jgi:anti-sigma regulatory factor (Ser/Thr protein kinase)
MVGRQDRNARELQLAASADSVSVARHAASEYAAEHGIDPDPVALAVSEVVTNAVVHAYRDDSSGEIALRLRLNGEGIIVTVADAGAGIRPNPQSPGLGYGLALVASVADEVAIARSDEGGTAVRMRFVSAA